MIIRVQSDCGTKRIDVLPTECTKSLYEKSSATFECEIVEFILSKSRNGKDEILFSVEKTLKEYKLNHGDMIFLLASKSRENKGTYHSDKELTPLPSTSKEINQEKISIENSMIEDQVDQIISKLDGRVRRTKNSMLCRHEGNSKCIHCSALDPWDEDVLKEANIKHLSFHSYLRKLHSGVDKGKFVLLEDINCKIKSGCKDHLPWPRGICSKCQPSAVTLSRQSFRHVDNVTFENAHIVERFINYWRTTGHQRIGFLYGRHEPYLDVPLGIKASVSAIYEPPQESSRDYVRLLPDPKRAVVDEVASGIGFTCVGWIFTDLVPEDANNGTVKYLRHGDTFFLSSHEVITAGFFQSEHPNLSVFSPSGVFGSKFTTVIVTGNKENQVHMEGYQVSNQCQALVRDHCLLPTKDAPDFAYVKESSSLQYVPDVYFKEKDHYGNEVVRLGRPLPVEYLLIDCPVSTPNEPIFTFVHRENSFPVENRMLDGHLQDFHALSSYLKDFHDCDFLNAVSDFHLLIYLASMETFPLRNKLGPLLQAVINKDNKAAIKWKKMEDWATLEQLFIAAEGRDTILPEKSSSLNAGPLDTTTSEMRTPSESSSWTCNHCTFINQTVSENCDICHLPR